MPRTLRRFLLAVAFLTAVPAICAGEVISELTDPLHPGLPDFLDILTARIEQDRGLLTFTIETRGPIPSTLPRPDDTITFLWFVDADNNPATGQPHNGLGSDFNVRAVIGQTYGGGYVDICGQLPGGGLGTVAVQGNRIQITIGLVQIAAPAQFHWCSATFQINNGMYVPGNTDTAVALATTLPYTPPAHVAITTPLLMLSPAGPTTGQLTVEIRDAAGNLLPLDDYHLSFQSTNPNVATVDGTGLVTVHSVPVQFNDTPYVLLTADGLAADNTAVIRSTTTNLGVQHQMYSGTRIAFYLSPSIEGVDLNQITLDYQVVEGTDLAYAAQQAGVGTSPFNGGRQYLVLDVSDDPVTVPCGTSGNPIRLGWEFGKPIHNSCYIINVPGNRVPQWGVIFHELGHNFNGASWSFNEFVSAPSALNSTYSEALATLCGLWSHFVLTRCHPTLGSLALDSMNDNFASSESYFRQMLTTYLTNGAHYASLEPNALDGILLTMRDAYGVKTWFDLFSTFLPPHDPLPYPLDSEARQATWFVAALSASAGTDLRGLFAGTYGFPLDDGAWPTILSHVQARINARPWQSCVTGDLNCDGAIDFADIDPFVLALTDQAAYEAAFPDCNYFNGDCNGDGLVDFADIDPFVALLAG